MIDLPSDLTQARELLETADKRAKARECLSYYNSALDLFDSHLETDSSSPFRSFIENVRLTYARALMRKLPVTNACGFGDWIELYELLNRMEEECSVMTTAHPGLKRQRDEFIELYFSDYLHELQELLRKIEDMKKQVGGE